MSKLLFIFTLTHASDYLPPFTSCSVKILGFLCGFFLQFLSHIHSAVFQNCNEDIGVDEDDDDDDSNLLNSF